ncbi:FAD-binding oxidoreductase [uncultured Alsobacter sp.]|uniref:FAD-binding oxidoreductase n=1 Tax=uncultured Alsobacter sp. TaxID=1748258 RepID=UPI0025FBFF24|nr:FAD-binding oxidoreductase [uncultured Alsobacter sp.]
MLLDDLRTALGETAVVTNPDDRQPYERDWRHTVKGRALCVVKPRTTAEVATVMRLAARDNVSVVPQGGNTGMAAGAVPDGSGTQIVLSLSRMNAIRHIDPVGMTIEVEAGCILKTAQDAAEAQGRMLPVSLAAEGSAQIGGIVSTNAGGINVLRYGMTRQLVLGLEVVLADGTVVDGLRHLRKDNAGYDWKHLFVGSEGTLGIVTAAVLRIMPRPKSVVTALLSVGSAEQALLLLKSMQDELGDVINAFELISGFSLELVDKHFGLKAPIDAGDWFVLLEASSSLPGLRDAVEGALMTALEGGTAIDGVIAESQAQAQQIWALRERITEAELKEGRSAKHDVSVPIPALPAFLAEAREALETKAPGTRLNAFGHAGDGNVHFNVLLPEGQDVGEVNRLVHDIVAAHRGSISAEHGIGSYRVAELVRYRSAEELELSRLIRRSLDPRGLLNPGKVILP